jgi:hypothetical protein
MWRWILDEFYNNPKYSEIIYRVGPQQKKLLLLPDPNTPVSMRR